MVSRRKRTAHLDLLEQPHQVKEDGFPDAYLEFMQDVGCKNAEYLEPEGCQLLGEDVL
jgi:hypothetical protein